MRNTFVLFLIFTGVGCVDEKKFSTLEERVAALERDKQWADARLTNLETLTKAIPRESGNFTVEERGFQPVQTNYGAPLYIALDNVEPYANGYRALFEFGNPAAVDFNGGEFRVWWGPKQDFKKMSLDEWSKQTQNKKQRLTTLLRRGAWNRVEVILVPATPDQIGSIEIDSIVLDQISLSR